MTSLAAEEGTEEVAHEEAVEEVVMEEAQNDGEVDVVFNTEGGITTAVLSEEGKGVSAAYYSSGSCLAVTVSENGTYSFEGEAENTVISVNSALKNVNIVFSGLTVDNSGIADMQGTDSSALSIGKKSIVSLKLTGENSIEGSSTAEDPEGIIKAAQSTLVISGTGSLGIIGIGDGISAKKGSVTVDSGTLNIIECADGIKAKSGDVTINGGTVNLRDIFGDGLQAENVTINGGIINISTVFDNAAVSYYTSGSSSNTLNTLTENEQSGTKTERINVDTGSHKGIKAGTKASTKIYSDTNETEVTEASGGLSITGGTITIDTTGSGLKAGKVSGGSYIACASGTYIIGSPDDAIQSNNTLDISGGTITVRSSDDGISSAGTLNISGDAKIDIQRAYEGIEAAEIVIGENGKSNGPVITVYSCDDGINASSKTLTYTYDSAENTDCYYTKSSASNKNNSCTVYSGKLTIKIDSGNVDSTHSVTLRNGNAENTKTLTYSAEADGIDCNGSLDIEGGEVYVYGQSSGANSPLDTDSGFTLGAGATILATGSNDMCSESLPSSGGAVYLSVGNSAGGQGGPGGPEGPGGPGGPGSPGQQNCSISFATGSAIAIKNGDTAIYEGILPYAGSFAIYASSELVKGTEYTVTIGSTTMNVTAVQAGSVSGQGDEQQLPTPPDNKDINEPIDNPVTDEPTDFTVSENTVYEVSGQDYLVELVSTGENSFRTEMVKGQKYCFGNGAWTSTDNKTVKIVKKSGNATAKKTGEVILTNSGADGNTYITVTVHQPTLSLKKAGMIIGEKLELSISDTGSMPVSWTSTNASVIRVEGDQYGKDGVAKGTITAIGNGSAKLKCFVGGKVYTASITVKAGSTAPIKTDVYLNTEKMTTLKNRFADGSSIAWDIVSGNSVTLENTDKTKVTIKAESFIGDTLIRCTVNGTEEYYTTVHVEDPSLENLTAVKQGSFNYTYAMKVGDSFKLSQPGLSQKALWTSSSKKKLFVNEYGTAVARQKGKVLLKTKVNGKWVKIRVVITE